VFDPLAALPDLHAHLEECSYPAPPLSGPVSVPAHSPFDSAEYPAVEEGWLDGRARVVNVSNVLDLVQHAAEPHALVVLDCNRPAVRPVAVAALAEELPARTRVMLWGPSVDDEDAIRTLSAATDRWIRCDSAAPASLAKRCVELVS
jgi:hypothetical protein